MRTAKLLFILHSLFISSLVPLWGQGTIVSSLEQYNFQVGDATVALRSFDGFDEIAGFDDVTGLSLSINGQAPEIIPFHPFYEAFKRGINYDTLESMLAERPIDGAYTHNLTGTPSGLVTITAPGIPYEDAIPINPVFTISGISGTWGVAPDGGGCLYFDPATTTSFTVTMNGYSTATQGSHYVYALNVGENSSEFNRVDGYSSGLVVAGEESPVPESLSLTFTKGLGLDAGDDDPSTYGFVSGTRFHLEGEHINVFGLADAGLGAGVAIKAFVYQAVTQIELVAVGDPLAEFPVATGVEVTFASAGADSFTFDWQTTPSGAPVDIYGSDDLVSWEGPVSTINLSGSCTESISSSSKGFFVVVPSGTPYPPAP